MIPAENVYMCMKCSVCTIDTARLEISYTVINIDKKMIVSLMPQDPLCINFKQIPADFQPGSGQIELYNEQNTKSYNINAKKDLEV